jgi:hypothetical protein
MARRGDGIYQRGRLCIMLASLCALLSIARSASAECAWVLWQQDADNPPQTKGGWRDLESCRAEIRRKVGTGASAAVSKGDDWMIYQTADGQRHYVGWQCLPDTVDPRGSKGPK